MSTPSNEQSNPSVEAQALSKVHQFFSDIESEATQIFGHLSDDAKNLLTKLRGQVHEDVQAAGKDVQIKVAASQVGSQDAETPPAS